MRGLSILAAALALSISTGAVATPPPCFTEESSARAHEILTANGLWPRDEPSPTHDFSVIGLRCDARWNRRVTCTLMQPRSDALGENVLAAANTLRLCPGEPRHVEFYLMVDENPEPTPDPSP